MYENIRPLRPLKGELEAAYVYFSSVKYEIAIIVCNLEQIIMNQSPNKQPVYKSPSRGGGALGGGGIMHHLPQLLRKYKQHYGCYHRHKHKQHKKVVQVVYVVA